MGSPASTAKADEARASIAAVKRCVKPSPGPRQIES
jgi:hypothetical protein